MHALVDKGGIQESVPGLNVGTLQLIGIKGGGDEHTENSGVTTT